MNSAKYSLVFIIIFLFNAVCVLGQEVTMVPVNLDGKVVRLEMNISKPEGSGPFPTIVLNHGSTGDGRDQRAIKAGVYYFRAINEFFVKRGWAVVAPMRRGRSGSEGIYDEGFAEDRTQGYTCEFERSAKGAKRALSDIEAAIKEILTFSFVDSNRVIIGGISRGGILSVAYAGQHPEQIKGVINFVGGWIGEVCPTAEKLNQDLFTQGASFPMNTIWLYGNNDMFYSLSHSRKNFKAFQLAGGMGEFHEIEPPNGITGHLIGIFPDLWSSLIENYLKNQGLPWAELKNH